MLLRYFLNYSKMVTAAPIIMRDTFVYILHVLNIIFDVVIARRWASSPVQSYT